MHLSIIMPALDAAPDLPATLAALGPPVAGEERILVDGGSRDEGPALARAVGFSVITAPRGRGPQLAAGAAAARGDWLLFLHADTRLGPGWRAAVEGFAARGPGVAAFAFALDDPHPAARRIERLVAWRCRAWGLPYGDQGLLVDRATYEAAGGFRPLPLMEDVDLVRRLWRISGRPPELLDVAAVTSAVRYRRDGWIARPLRNLVCLALWRAGVPPRLIARLYG